MDQVPAAPAPPVVQAPPKNPPLTPLQLFLIFARVGALSWGGGGATLAMLHTEFCARRPLLPEAEFQVLFSLSRLLPGMNLLSLTVLLGHRCHKWLGAVLALLGLTLPSFALIVLGCWLLRGRQDQPYLAAAVRGLKPAVVALLLHTAWQLSEKSLRPQPPLSRLLWLALVAGAALLAVRSALHPAWIILGSGVLGILASRWTLAPRSPTPRTAEPRS